MQRSALLKNVMDIPLIFFLSLVLRTPKGKNPFLSPLTHNLVLLFRSAYFWDSASLYWIKIVSPKAIITNFGAIL